MSKLILNGTNGITGYKADNTTVQQTLSLAELNTAKSDVFTSSSSLTISGKMTADASLTPAVLRYSVGEKELSGLSFEFIATNTEQFAEPDSTHTLPTGIQSGDLIVMLEHAILSTSQGYGISIETPSGWTSGMGGNFTSWYYKPSNYEVAYAFVNYKIAGASDSGTSVSGFQNPSNVHGTVYGQRTCFVYRPTFSNSGNVSISKVFAQAGGGSSSFSPYTSSVTATPSTSVGTLGIAHYASSGSSNSATLSGAVTSFDTSSTAGYGTTSIRTCIRGAFNIPPTSSNVTLTGTANTTACDATGIWIFTLS
jgi:hypothetical protein